MLGSAPSNSSNCEFSRAYSQSQHNLGPRLSSRTIDRSSHDGEEITRSYHESPLLSYLRFILRISEKLGPDTKKILLLDLVPHMIGMGFG